MRKVLDRYLTRRSWDVEQLLRNVDIRGDILETCCGEQDIVKTILANEPSRGRILDIHTNDIDPNIYAEYHLDASNSMSYAPDILHGISHFPSVDWHITNPPYNIAPKIIPLAFAHARVGIAMLLRLTYLEPTTRSKRKDAVHRGWWLQKYPPTDLLILPRYSYTGDGKTDSVTSAWMVWDKRHTQELSATVRDGDLHTRYQRILCLPEPPSTKELKSEYPVTKDEAFECDGTNCPPTAHDHKVLL